jgi:hypothetical protein
VRDNPQRTTIELVGVERTDLPVRVVAFDPREPFDDRIEQAFVGRPEWPLSSLTVPSLRGVQRLAALGRSRSFVSGDVALDAAAVRVPMRPATRLRVRWFGHDPGADLGALLAVDARRETFTAAFVPRVVELEGASRLALVANAVVVHGRLALTGLRADGGVAWRRDVDASGPWTIVDVGLAR